MSPDLLLVGVLVWLGVGLSVLCGLLWRLSTRREPRTLGWEVVDSVDVEEPPHEPSVAGEVMPNPPIRRRRVVRPVDVSAPWDGEAPGYVPSVTFPDEFLRQWPDEKPPPAMLPDEGEAR